MYIVQFQCIGAVPDSLDRVPTDGCEGVSLRCASALSTQSARSLGHSRHSAFKAVVSKVRQWADSMMDGSKMNIGM